MSEQHNEISRRSVLKGVAVSGVGLVVGGSLLASCGGEMSSGTAEILESNDEWFSRRVWAVSGNKVVTPSGGTALPTTTLARRIYRPLSAQEIADVVKSLPATTPIACVGGGHESSNAAVLANSDAVILDMARLKSIDFHHDGESKLVTVGAGVVFRELVEALKHNQGALPVGTGASVGVVGYLVNGGLSGYFSRRLGLLGQRVVKLTVVTPSGDIRVLTAEDELFVAMLGAGSALGIVVDATIRAEHESAVQSAEQRVIAFETRAQAVEFSRGAVRFMRDRVLPNNPFRWSWWSPARRRWSRRSSFTIPFTEAPRSSSSRWRTSPQHEASGGRVGTLGILVRSGSCVVARHRRNQGEPDCHAPALHGNHGHSRRQNP